MLTVVALKICRITGDAVVVLDMIAREEVVVVLGFPFVIPLPL